MYLPKDDYIQNPDFSAAKGNAQHWFIHEMVHVWQYQMGVSNGWLGLKQLCKGGYTSQVNSADSGSNELKAYDTDITGRDLNKNLAILILNNKDGLLSYGLMLVIYKIIFRLDLITKKFKTFRVC